MNNLTKLYQLCKKNEMTPIQNTILDSQRIKRKVLAIINEISTIGELTHIYTFWEKDNSYNKDDVIEHFVIALKNIMSIAYEIRMDEIKNFEEIPNHMSKEDILFKIYRDLDELALYFRPLSLDNAINDIFHLAYILNISFDDILEKFK